jgi:ferredoxin
MPIRKIVNIDQKLCNGCGACIPKCAEGALIIENGKARIAKETYCDGLGACLGQCPQGAITVTEREAPDFSEKEVTEYLKSQGKTLPHTTHTQQTAESTKPQWPVKINLIPVKAPFFEGSELLVAADCAPVAVKDFAAKFMNGKRVAIGCPKFDDARAYAQKLGEILRQNNIVAITVAHMEVPCCVGLKWAVDRALEASGKKIPVREYEIKVGGEIIEL